MTNRKDLENKICVNNWQNREPVFKPSGPWNGEVKTFAMYCYTDFYILSNQGGIDLAIRDRGEIQFLMVSFHVKGQKCIPFMWQMQTPVEHSSP